MSKFLHHEPCSECGSRDNLGVWDDGHKFCFGCGYYVPNCADNSIQDIHSSLCDLQKQQQEDTINHAAFRDVPVDCTRNLPTIAVEWLQQFKLTKKEIYQQNSFLWSDAHESLIYTVFDIYGNLLMWQSRYFGNNSNAARFHTAGPAGSCYHIFDRHGTATTLTLVEDIISAIKVGRVAHAMPLWGSDVSYKRLLRLSHMYQNLNIWLDKDKQKYSVGARQRASIFFNHARCIITELDPKRYSTGEINGFLK